MKKNLLFIDGFILKLIAFFLMTLDHIGIFMEVNPNEGIALTGQIFRLLGRLAFPLFVLMLVEGVRHTKSFAKYALRLGIVATMVLLAQVIIYYFIDNSIGDAFSPLLDLLCYGTILYLISRKDKFSYLAIIPFVVIALSFAVNVYEANTGTNILWFPVFLRSGYNIFGFIMAVIMYFAYPFLRKFFIRNNMDEKDFEKSTLFQFSLNVAYSFAIFFAVVCIYLIAKIPGGDLFGVAKPIYSETWAIASILIVIFYTGKRGFNPKWFQYASYLYFPLHLVIIYLVFYLISLGA